MSTFGEWIKDQRYRRDLTQGELAAMADVSINTISAIENGNNSHPATRRIIRETLAKVPIPEMPFTFAEDKQPEMAQVS